MVPTPWNGRSQSATAKATAKAKAAAPVTNAASGWFSTKKRGRDDAEIAASRKRALMMRTRHNNHSNNNKKKASTGVVAAASRRRRRDEDDDDDDISFVSSSSSINDFIASEDDEDEDEDFEEESDDNGEENEEEDDDDIQVLSPPKKSSKVHRIQANSQSKTIKSNSTVLGGKTSMISHTSSHTYSYSTTTPKTMELSSPESVEYLTSPSVPMSPIRQTKPFVGSKPHQSQTTKPRRKAIMESDSSSSGDDSDDSKVRLVLQGSGLNRRRGPGTQDSCVVPHDPRRSMDSLASMVATQPKRISRTPSQSSNNSHSSSSSSIRSVKNEKPPSAPPLPPKAHPPPKQPQPPQQQRANPFAQFALPSAALEDTDDDSHDEQVAIQLAIKKSLQDRPVVRKKGISKPQRQTPFLPKPPSNNTHKLPSASRLNVGGDDNDIDDEEEEPLATEELLKDSSSSSEGDDNDDDDEPHDSHEQKVATSVLETAASLSAQVLATMNQWASSSSTTTATNAESRHGHSTHPADKTNASHGLIDNGALSLGTISNTTLPPHAQWISQETMQQACPGVTLSKYQLIGVNWLALLHGMKCTLEQGAKDTPVNGVLADEMGLGKTAQTIAFLAWLKYQRREQQSTNDYRPPHIIVVPVSVLPNWMREFETFAPHMKVIKYHGSMAERELIQDELQNHLPGRRQYPRHCLDALLVPVTYYQKEKSDDRRFLNKFRFDYLVVDEAHMLKNSLSTRYKMLNKLNTQHRLLLTGTPVQNSPQELLNMLCFIMPLFSKGSESFEDGDDGTSVGDRMLQHFVDAEQQRSGDEQIAYAKLKQLFAPFVLRRKKDDVIAQLLPPKTKVVEYVELDDAGRKIYNSILEDHIQKNGTKATTTVSIGEHLFTNLRKAAHHPLLLRTRHNTPSEVEHLVTYFHKYQAFAGEGSTKAKVGEELAKYNDFQIHLTALDLLEENPHRRPDLERYILGESALFSSAKFSRLRTLLPDLIEAKGHRVLIFSGWTSCLDLLGCLMEQLGLQYLRMDGSCPSDIRQARIDEFNSNSSIPVFLLSTRACGLGINLTAADTCIMHDLDFNPFNDLQAEDRCHRIGQTKPVTVYKFVSKDTVDADIYEMQERKAKMNAAIMESATNKAMEVGKSERKAILQSVVQKFLSPQASKSKPRDTLIL